MKMMKRKMAVLLSLLLVAALATGCGTKNRLMMGTGGTAGTYYAYGGVLAQYMKTYAEASVTAVSTDASKANIQSIEDGDYQLGIVQSDVMTYAWNDTRAFNGIGTQDFRVIGGLYAETVQLITMDSSIKSVADLKGRSVSIGAPGSGVNFNAQDVLAAAGLTESDIRPQYQSFEDSKEALKDGKIDAAFIVAGAPTTAITELATTNGVKLVPIDGELREKMLKDDPYYSAYEIPANTYPGQPEAISTVTVKATLIVQKDVDEAVVYRLTQAIFDHKEEITTENAKGKELSVKNATEGISVPFHSGAAKYYEEHGVSVNTQ